MVQPQSSEHFRRTVLFIIIIASAVLIRAGFVGDGSWYFGLLGTIPAMIILANKKLREPGKTHHHVGHRTLMKRA